ncbi:MAG: type IV-A pilus assembly ATPase PilB [Deltaproteobacteria bacterium]|nr:type IV-A pilus assembly ATPase PilB [Deltaproteobacteria bacterium]
MEPRIAEILVRGGVINRDQLKEALDTQKKNGTNLVHELVRLGYTNEDKLTSFLGQQFGIEMVDLENAEIQDPAFNLVPIRLVHKYQLVPLKLRGSTLTVAMSDPTNLAAINEIKFITGCGVRVVLSSGSAIKKVLDQRLGSASYDEVLKQIGESEVEVIHDEEISLQELQQATNDAPVVLLVNAIMADAAKRRASDIHIEPYEKTFRVRFRVDGILDEIMTPPPRLKAALVSRIKIMANLDIAERRLTQDGRIKLKIGVGLEIDIRVSVLPTMFGEKIVMRLLDKSNLQLDMTMLGFESHNLKDFQEAVHRPYGMLLITGPTGSGKSTTLYSALSELNKVGVNISTAEDPVEYNITGINQVQVREEIGLSFAACLRSFLRQDPDIIMVGEIRDLETAQIAVKAALTGHLVLSTLHTNDAPSTVDRMINMGVEPFMITSSVNLIAAQRLVRTICLKCKVAAEVKPEVLIDIGVDPAELHAGFPTYHGTGCPDCNNTGYRGRLAIYEVMVMHEALKELVIRGVSGSVLKQEAVKLGMSTLRMSSLRKVREGLTTIEETIRVTDSDKGLGSVFSMAL